MTRGKFNWFLLLYNLFLKVKFICHQANEVGFVIKTARLTKNCSPDDWELPPGSRPCLQCCHIMYESEITVI